MLAPEASFLRVSDKIPGLGEGQEGVTVKELCLSRGRRDEHVQRAAGAGIRRGTCCAEETDVT